MSKAVIYSRVSTEEQADKGFSLIAQSSECRAKANELGCDEIYEFSEEGVSGSILERPMLINALDKIKQGEINYFICYEPSRLSRNVSHQLILIDTIKKHNTKLVFVRSSFEDTAEGRFQITIMAAVDEYERARLKIRTELGKRAKANQMLLTHNPNIYGYNFNKDKDCLTINETQSKIVQLIFQWVIEDGCGAAQIADKLNALNIPSMRNKSWSRVSINRILKNFSYTGTLYIRRFDTREYKLNKYKAKKDKIKIKQRPMEQWIAIEIPPIIDTITWQKAVGLLEKKKRTHNTAEQQRQMLTGLIKCGICGLTMYSKKSGSNTYYCCSGKYVYNKEEKECCQSKLHKASHLEQLIWQMVKNLILDKSNMAVIFKEVAENLSTKGSDASTNIVRDLVLKAEQEKLNVLRLFQKSLISELELDKTLVEIDTRLSELSKNNLNDNRMRLTLIENGENLKNMLEKKLDEMTGAEKNRLLQLFVEQIIVTEHAIILKILI